MRSSFKVLFYLRKNQLNKEGKAGIMIRLTVNGEMTQFSAKLDVEPDLWDTKNGKIVGKTLYSSKLNALLDNIKAALINHFNEIEKYDTVVTKMLIFKSVVVFGSPVVVCGVRNYLSA